MNQSEQINEITVALLVFHKSVGRVGKSATNPFFKSKYAPLSSILAAIEQPLIDAELVVTQWPTGEHELTTQISHTSGQWIRSAYKMEPMVWDKNSNEYRLNDTPQGIGSCITYQRRYALGAALSLNIDDDDDGNAASQPVSDTRPNPKSNWKDYVSPSTGARLEELDDETLKQLCDEWLPKQGLIGENWRFQQALIGFHEEMCQTAESRDLPF